MEPSYRGIPALEADLRQRRRIGASRELGGGQMPSVIPPFGCFPSSVSLPCGAAPAPDSLSARGLSAGPSCPSSRCQDSIFGLHYGLHIAFYHKRQKFSSPSLNYWIKKAILFQNFFSPGLIVVKSGNKPPIRWKSVSLFSLEISGFFEKDIAQCLFTSCAVCNIELCKTAQFLRSREPLFAPFG